MFVLDFKGRRVFNLSPLFCVRSSVHLCLFIEDTERTLWRTLRVRVGSVREIVFGSVRYTSSRDI